MTESASARPGRTHAESDENPGPATPPAGSREEPAPGLAGPASAADSPTDARAHDEFEPL